jgi:hypothetical protein
MAKLLLPLEEVRQLGGLMDESIDSMTVYSGESSDYTSTTTTMVQQPEVKSGLGLIVRFLDRATGLCGGVISLLSGSHSTAL